MTETLTPSQARIVDAVAAHGPATAQHIAELTGLGYSTVTALLRKLATAGLVTRQHDLSWTAPARRPQEDTSANLQPSDEAATDPVEEVPPAGSADDLYAEDATGTGSAAEPQRSADNGEAAADTEDDIHEAHAHKDDVQPDLDGDARDGDQANVQETADSAADSSVAESREETPDEEPVVPADDATASQTAEPSTAAGQQPPSDVEHDDTAAASGPRRRYNKTGKPPRAKGELYTEVRTYFLAHPGEALTPRVIGKAIDASDGAVVNVCHKLVTAGDIAEVASGKVAFVHQPPQP